MSDLDNSNLTNEEENSGFSPSDADNKSFSADKGSSVNATGNNDWGQANYFVKPSRKMPLWPFLLVGAFVLIGIILLVTAASDRNRQGSVANAIATTHFEGYADNHTKEIAINRKVVVNTKNMQKHSDGWNHYNMGGKCTANKDCKPGGKCKPADCKTTGKCYDQYGKPMPACGTKNCKTTGKCYDQYGKPMPACGTKNCKTTGKCYDQYGKPMAKCLPKECKPMAKCYDKRGKPMHKFTPNECKSSNNKLKCTKNNIKNCKEVEIQVINNQPPVAKTYPPKPTRKVINPKEGKLALQSNDKGLYVLQVYSALSKEEADVKYDEFKSKGVEKVWVSTYANANVVWYRVRIGDFTTKAAADAKAKELGLSTYWVDKIR